jgi:hypothetical protein
MSTAAQLTTHAVTMHNLFYHGSPTAIHQQVAHYLDPSRARLNASQRWFQDVDPDGPHVLLTKIMLEARLFSMKSGNQLSNGAQEILQTRPFHSKFLHESTTGKVHGVAHAIYAERPLDLDETGYVYVIDQQLYQTFSQIEYWWYSRENIDVKEHHPIIVRGIRELIETDQVTIFYLRCGRNEGSDLIRESINLGRRFGYQSQFEYLVKQSSAGLMGCLNEE